MASIETIADLLDDLGGIDPRRVRYRPLPGTATEADVLRAGEGEGNRLCELVDGVLVEKPMGYREALLAALVAHYLLTFVRPRRLGLVAGADGMMRIAPGLVRMPDVSFVARSRLPGGQPAARPIAPFAPDLAVEVLSRGNTAREMARKRREYFAAGTRLVWEIDPRRRTVTVYTAADAFTRLGEADTLDGVPVLPGFALPIAELFADP